MASLHKSSLGHHHHPLSCNPGFRFDQFYLLLTVFFCSGVSSRTRSRSRQAGDSSTDMSLPDPRPVVAPRRRRQPPQQVPPPQPEQVPCENANLLLRRYSPNHLRFMEDGEPVRQPDPIPQPDRTPSPNPMLRRYRTNHMRFME